MGKRIVNVTKDVDLAKLYGVDEGVALVKKCATAKFDETVELHARLGVDPKQADQQVRGTVGLPHGLGKTKKVAVVTQGEKQKDATAAGADMISITSFNEWPETTVVEPALTWPDPYLYLKILAEFRGIRWRTPLLPPAGVMVAEPMHNPSQLT